MNKKYIQKFEKEFLEMQKKTFDLAIKKHLDYGGGHLKDFGDYGILVRQNDKIARLKNLYKKSENLNESVEDTWMDINVYAILALMYRKGFKFE